MTTTAANPTARPDGLCHICHKPRRIARPPAKTIPPRWYQDDPFCSSTCARHYHGAPAIPAGIYTRQAT